MMPQDWFLALVHPDTNWRHINIDLILEKYFTFWTFRELRLRYIICHHLGEEEEN
mgnify:FL=1